MIVTLEEVKDFLQLKNETFADDALEDEIIPGVLAQFPNSLDEEDYTEYQDGDDYAYFYTVVPNISAVSFLGIVDEDLATVREYESTEFVFRADGEVKLRTGTFPGGVKNIKIIYTAGFKDTLPIDLKLALLKDIANVFHDSGYEKRSSEDVQRKPYYWQEIS